jgi:hypothetical protein
VVAEISDRFLAVRKCIDRTSASGALTDVAIPIRQHDGRYHRIDASMSMQDALAGIRAIVASRNRLRRILCEMADPFWSSSHASFSMMRQVNSDRALAWGLAGRRARKRLYCALKDGKWYMSWARF